jgi:hypothetical protein
VAGVTVSIRNVETGSERKVLTDETGRYNAISLAVGLRSQRKRADCPSSEWRHSGSRTEELLALPLETSTKSWKCRGTDRSRSHDRRYFWIIGERQ